MAFVYILYSEILDKFYVGHTSENIEERLRKHSSEHRGFTSRAKDWKVVYCEELADKSSAYRREIEIKSWKSKIKIKELIDRAG